MTADSTRAEDPLFVGLFDAGVTAIPEKTAAQARTLASLAPAADTPGRWVACARLPIPVGEMGVIACQGRIHVIGGYARQRVDGDFHQVLDAAGEHWSLKAPLPFPCNHIALAEIDGRIYAFGGFIEQNRCPHSRCYVYDAALDRWSPIAPLGRPRGAASAVVVDGRIHLLGGRDVRSVEWHEVYDPEADSYRILAGMPGSTKTQPFVGQRDHMGVVVVDGRIHAIAGRMDSYDFNTGLHAVYDPKADGWSFRAPLPTPRSGPSAALYRGRILVIGGEATGRVFGTNEAYDPATDSWEALAPMALPRHGLHGATAALLGDRVHIPGGGPLPGGSIQGAYHDAFTLS